MFKFVLQPHAGAGKGFYFIPEIGEEVLVDFEDQNAERPFVLGSYYNGKQKSNYHTAGNDKKVIHTRSGTKIILNDAEGSVKISDRETSSIRLDGIGNTIMNSSESNSINVGGKKGQPQSLIKTDKNGDILIKGEKSIVFQVGENKITISKGGVNICVKEGNIEINSTSGSLDVCSENTLSISTNSNCNIISQKQITMTSPNIDVN